MLLDNHPTQLHLVIAPSLHASIPTVFMTMNYVYYKEHDDSSSTGSGRWWSGLSTRSNLNESVVLKCSTKPLDPDAHQVVDKTDITQFNVIIDECKDSSNKQKPSKIQVGFSMRSDQSYVELGLSQPTIPTMVCGEYAYGDQCYGLFSAYGPQIKGRVMLPLNLGSDDGPMFVNAKQYNGIIRRRRSRAKAEMANKALKSRKPYLHLSRHLHAMRRPRGNGGRFLNSKRTGNCKDESMGVKKDINSPKSPSYTILLSSNSNLNSLQESNSNGSHVPRSEVTSTLSFGGLKHFQGESLSRVSLSNMMSGNTVGNVFGMHGKRVVVGGSGGSRFDFAM
ncbi:hypothetical protein QVD17_37553 [Tagetes erecta]|uniref:Nuclear transcription factor Y subunit n=1 Tax=Tagetes erecta TaxID=13708 RepID=A0AAD8K0R1_TARER|nr:hypothetical protein QVD17_37553 [Tagetes erecta]